MTKTKLAIVITFLLLLVAGNSHANTAFTMTNAELLELSGGHTMSVGAADGYAAARNLRVVIPSVATTNVTGALAEGATLAAGGAVARKGIGYIARGIPVLGVAITGYMLYNDLRQIANSDPTTYPNLTSALSRPDLPSVPYVGAYVQAANGNVYQASTCYSTSGFTSSPTMQNDADATSWQIVIYGPYAYNPSYGYSGYTFTRYYGATTGSIVSPGSVPQVPLSDAEIEANFNSVNAQTLAEIDQAMQNNPEKVQAPTAAEAIAVLQAAEAQRAIDEKAKQVTTLTELVESLQQQYNANPTPENLAKLKQAQADLANAKSQLITLEQQPTPTEEDETMPQVATDTLKTFDWSAIQAVTGALANTFPVKQIMDIPGCLVGLCSDPVAPSFQLPIYGDNHLDINLSMFDPVATCFRWIFGLFVTVGGIMGAVRFYRGVS